MIKNSVLLFLCLNLFLSCKNKNEKDSDIAKAGVNTLSKSQIILNETIKAHGGDLYNTAHYSFVFRGTTFEFKNDNNNYQYTKTSKKESDLIIDILSNGKLSRTINNESIKLSEKETNSASESINSVIYFATLPYKLNDSAVNHTYIGETTIKDKGYDILGITFNKEGGGKDYDDEFHYWINKETKRIDYLAYNYKVNKGGVRFRSAYNTRVVNGIVFQDYINYKAEVGTPLKDLPSLFEVGELKELSKIETKNIIKLKTKKQ